MNGSILLISNKILPDAGIHWQTTEEDIAMVIRVASQGRIEEQWYSLLDSSGLNTRRSILTALPVRESIIAAVPK